MTGADTRKTLWLVMLVAAGLVLFVGGTMLTKYNPLLLGVASLGMVVVMAGAASMEGMLRTTLLTFSFVLPVLVFPFSVYTYLRLDDLMVMGLIAWWLLDRQHRLNPVTQLRKSGLMVPFLALYGLATISLLHTMPLNPTSAALEKKAFGSSVWFLVRFFEAGVAFIITLSARVEREFFGKTARLIVGLAILMSFLGLLQYAGVLPEYDYLGFRQKHITTGVTSYMSYHYSHFGSFLVIAVLLAVELSEASIHKKWWFGIVGFLTITLVLNQSRSSWLACAVAFVAYAFSRGQKVRRLYKFGLLGLVAIAILLQLGYGARLKARFGFGRTDLARASSDSAKWRLENTSTAMDYVATYPSSLLVGIGFMNWRYEVNRFTEYKSAGGHNNFLSVMIELGLLGLAAFIWVWLGAVRKFRKNVLRAPPGTRAMQAALMGLFVSCLTQETFYPAASMESLLTMLCFLVGLWLNGVANHSTPPVANCGRTPSNVHGGGG